MEITFDQLKIFKTFSDVPTKIMRRFFESDEEKRREIIYNISKSGHIKSVKMFNFFINNIKTERAEDIILPNMKMFIDEFPKRFNNMKYE